MPRPIPIHPSGPTGPSGPTSPTAPTNPTAPAPTPAAVTPETPFRQCGDTDAQHFAAAIDRSANDYQFSHMRPEADAIYAAVTPGFSRLAAAMAWHETKNFTLTGIPAASHNPWAVSAGMQGGVHIWRSYPTFAAAAADWIAFVGNASVFPAAATLRQFIAIYAPPSDGNDVETYLRVICDQINALPAIGAPPSPGPALKAWPIAGSAAPLLLPPDVLFKQALIPASQKNQRPGIAMTPQYFTQHDTANTAAGADAEMHSRWLDQGAPGGDDPSGKVGFHFVSDDKIVIQKIPVNEVTWHAGDGGGPGNMQSVGAELCVNRDRDAAKAERNAAALAAGLLGVIGQPLDRMRTHLSWVGPSGHHCPASLLDRWPWYQQQVAVWMTGGQPTPAAPIFPNPANVPDELMQRWFAWADPTGPITRWWLANRVAHGKMPDLLFNDPGKTYVFSDGTTLVYADGKVTEVTTQ